MSIVWMQASPEFVKDSPGRQAAHGAASEKKGSRDGGAASEKTGGRDGDDRRDKADHRKEDKADHCLSCIECTGFCRFSQ